MSSRGIRSRVKGWFLRRFDVVDVSEKAGIQWLSVAGMLGDRIEAMEKLETGEGFLNWSAFFFRAALPWFTTRQDIFMREKLIAWLDNYEIFETKIKPLKIGKYPGLEIYEKTLGISAKYADEIDNPEPAHNKANNQSKRVYDVEVRKTEVDRTYDRIKEFLISDAKILLADSFTKEALATSATYVVSKAEIPATKEHGPAVEGLEMINQRIADLEERQRRAGGSS